LQRRVPRPSQVALHADVLCTLKPLMCCICVSICCIVCRQVHAAVDELAGFAEAHASPIHVALYAYMCC
jgi:hypothetical protein